MRGDDRAGLAPCRRAGRNRRRKRDEGTAPARRRCDAWRARATVNIEPDSCWHCGEPLPADPPQARVAGVARPVCCIGCRAVAEWIGELGLADYYRLRSGLSARAPDPDDSAKNAAAFLRPELSRHLVRALADGNSEAILLLDGVRCTACCWLVEGRVGLLPGVDVISVEGVARGAGCV